MTVKDEQGNERELLVGDLVKVAMPNGADYCFRVRHITEASANYEAYVNCADWLPPYGDYFKPDKITWLSSEPVSEDKEPTLAMRRQRLEINLKAAYDRTIGSDSDACLIHRLRMMFRSPQQHPWFWRAVTESIEDPRKVSFATSMLDVDNNSRRRFCSVSKFLKGKAREYGADFTDEEANRIGELVGNHFPDTYDYTFKVVNGGVEDAYNSDEGNAFSSCMQGCSYVRWYDDNPDKVGIVKIMQGPRYVGRALIWNTDQGVTVVDRVYPSNNGPHTNALHAWCEKNGYDYKTRQSSCPGYFKSARTDYTVMMSKWPSNGYFPYIDTFAYTNDDPKDEGPIKLKCNGEGQYTFQSTGGGYDGGVRCCQCGRIVDEDDANYADGDYYCDDCFGENFVHLDYRLPNGRWVEVTVSNDDCVECEHCEEARRCQDTDNVRIGRHNVTWCLMCIEDDATACDGCGYLRENDDITVAEEGNAYCSKCFKETCSTCEECGSAHETENMLVADDKHYCSDCAPEGAEAAEKEEEVKAEPTPTPAPVAADAFKYPECWPVNSINLCPCITCVEITRRRRAYFLEQTHSLPNGLCPCGCGIQFRLFGATLPEYLAAPYPNAHERRLLAEQNHPAQPVAIDSPSSTASNPYWNSTNDNTFAGVPLFQLFQWLTSTGRDIPVGGEMIVETFIPEEEALNG